MNQRFYHGFGCAFSDDSESVRFGNFCEEDVVVGIKIATIPLNQKARKGLTLLAGWG
jgi:hypothetical protein